MGFIDVIKEKAKQNVKTIVLPETEDKRTYEAAEAVLKEGTAKLILVGSNPFSTNRSCSCSMPKPTACLTQPTLLMMGTVVLPMTAPVFRKCSLRSKPVM